MTDAPETIWARPDPYEPDWTGDKTLRSKSHVEYRRADLAITTAQLMADPRVKSLVDAGEVMAKALRGDYIVPGSAKAWDAALAQLKEPKVKELLNVPTMQ